MTASPRALGTPDSSSATDEELAARAAGGDGAALDRLLRRHQSALFNLALYMLQTRADAEDATQEILLKLTTGLGSFRGMSVFRTWAWRVAVNHILDRRRSRAEQSVASFACFAGYLERSADEELQAGATSQERALLVEEAARTCTMGMLLCLDRSQRVAFLLGEVLEVKDSEAAEVLELTAVNFRQRLARARRDLTQFLQGRCGLVDRNNPCRCVRKTQAFIRDGVVDPERLEFTREHLDGARGRSRRPVRMLTMLDERAAHELRELFPERAAPDIAARLSAIIAGPDLERRERPGTVTNLE